MNFNLKTNKAPYSLLNGDDLWFFYYDVCIDTIPKNPEMYDWEKIISPFTPELDIDTCKKGQVPNQPKENMIRFTKYSGDRKSKAMAFFRHLRNAFAHYNIEREGDWFIIKDSDPKNPKLEYTFMGKIKAETLKKICFSFFEYRDQILNKYN